ncbi:reverse transcriptase domain-containing protein [Tanacetum coccineum]
MTVVLNDNNEPVPSRTVTRWRVCIDYRKLNDVTRKDHFPLLFIDQMLEHLSRNEFYCFLDGFSGFFQIPIALEDQEKTTFTCPYETFDYRRMPFGLCNAPATFQRYMTAIFHDMVEDFMKVFMDDFLVFDNSFNHCLEVEHKAYWALKQCNMDLTAAAKNRFMALNELMELRDEAYKNTRIYKEKTKKWHDSRLRGDKNFTAGDKVLLFYSRFRLHPGKLKLKWSEPFTVKTMYPYGAVEITDKNNFNFKVNGHRLRKYYGVSINTEENELVELNEATRLAKARKSSNFSAGPCCK